MPDQGRALLYMCEETTYLFARAVLTVSCLRPFALLAAKTLLPLGVDILSLKPCLFLFFLSEGWNVLFITSVYSDG